MSVTTLTEAPHPLRRTSPSALADNAYEKLKLELLEGALNPGDNLSVNELAREFACSRVPIMEALKRLEGEGFVQIVPQVGCRVVIPALEDITDFFLLFAAVEGTVAALAAGRRSDADVERFRALCLELDGILRGAGSPASRDPLYRHVNLRFHGEIHRLARSPVASNLAASLWDRSDFYIKMVFGSLYFSKRVLRSHREIRTAIINGDPPAAESAVRAHLLRVGADIAKHMRVKGGT